MIEATISTEGAKLSLRLKGHAGYAEHGKDIVCASASILAYTLAQIVRVYEKNGCIKEPTIRLDSGDTEITCEPKDESTYDVLWDAYDFARVGCYLLAHNYPKYVRLMP